MINTTLAVLMFAVGMDLSVSPANLKWQTDYTAAMSRASEARKPMAVFIGQGDNIKQMVDSGTISAEAARLLASNYICVYLDTDTTTGKDLSGRFELSKGLVISSPGGNTQAYRYAGTVPAATLTQELTHYASAGEPKTTVAAGDAVSGGVVPANYTGLMGGCPNGRCPYAQPASGQYVPGSFVYPSSGSSCPNGRCPYQR